MGSAYLFLHAALALSDACLRLMKPQVRSAANHTRCGFNHDCERMYSLSDVNHSATTWNPRDPVAQRLFSASRERATSACAAGGNKTSQGGWCLDLNEATSKLVELPLGHSYQLPAHHVPASPHMLEQIQTLSFSAPRRYSFNDFGAGVGQYGHALLSQDPSFRWRGFAGQLVESALFEAYQPAWRHRRLWLLLCAPERSLSILDACGGLKSSAPTSRTSHFQPPPGRRRQRRSGYVRLCHVL